MAGYDLIKTILQNPDNFSNNASLVRLEALINAKNFATLKAEFEGNFAFWNALDVNLFNARQELDLGFNEAEATNCSKLAKKSRFDLAVKEFKNWLAKEEDTLSDDARFELFEAIAEVASDEEVKIEDLTKRYVEISRFTEEGSEELNKFKVYLRAQYIKSQIKTGNFTDQGLAQIAVCNTDSPMQSFFSEQKIILAPLLKEEDVLLDDAEAEPEKKVQVVDKDTFRELAETAAMRFIKNKIATCKDEAALEALATVKNIAGLKKIFKEHPALSLVGKQQELLNKLQETFIPAVSACALISQQINTASETKLRDIIIKNTKDELVAEFSSTVSGSKDVLEPYLTKPQNQSDVNNQAVIQLGKLAFQGLSDEVFFDLFDDLDEAWQEITALTKKKDLSKEEQDKLSDKQDELKNKLDSFTKLDLPYSQLFLFEVAALTEDFIRGNTPLDKINNLHDFGYRKKNNLEDLSPTELNAVAFRLAERIIQSTPANAASLVAADSLDKARNFFTTNLNMTNVTWLNEQNFKILRKSAYIAQIQGELVKLKPEEKDKHPALVRLLSQLSLNQLQQIQKKPMVYLPFLVNTTDKARFKDILGHDNAVPSLDDIIAENLSFQALFKIENAALVKIISTIPGLVITDEKVKLINDFLRAHNPHVPITKKEIVKLLKKVGVGPGFTLTDPDLTTIQAQFTYNAPLYALNGDRRTKPLFLQLENIYSFLLSYEKTAAITDSFVTDFKRALSNTDSLSEFKGAFPMVAEPLKQSIFKNLTPALFQKLKEELFKFNLADVNQFDTILHNDRRNFLHNLKERFDVLQEAEEKTEVWFGERKTLHTELEKITKLDFISIQLTLEKAPDEDFKSYQQHLQQLEEACDAAIPELTDQLALLTARYESLIATNVDASNNGDKLDYMREIRQQIQLVRKELTFHKKAKLALRGDPSEPADSLKNKGAMQVMLETKTHQRILPEQIFKGYKIQYGEYKNEDRDEVLKTTPAYKPVNASKLHTHMAANPTSKEETIATKKSITGTSSVVRVTKTNASGVDEDVAKFIDEPLTRGNKLTIAMFPSKIAPGSKGQALNIDYVVASFTAAEAYLLKRKQKGISAKVPIVINGETREEVEGLYFALRTLLDKYPQKGLTPASVKLSEEALLCYDPRNIFGSYVDRDLTYQGDLTNKAEMNEKLVSDIKNNPLIKRKIDEALEAWNPVVQHQKASKELLKRMDKNVHQDLKAGLTTLKQKAQEKPDEGLQKTPALKASDAEETPKGIRLR